MDPESWFRPRQRGFGAPWALAEIARVSLAYGNEHRPAATEDHLLQCSNAYTDLNDPELGDGYQGPLTGFFLRICEQLEYQVPLQNEMSRAAAIFLNTKPAGTPRVIRDDWQTELFGTDLISFVAAGQMLHMAARPNSGRFNPNWLDLPNFSFLPTVIDPARLRTAWRRNYVIDQAAFKKLNGRQAPSPWRRFTHNPLLSHPAVSGIHNDWLIPTPALVVRRLSPLGIYYAGLNLWGKPFADDLGDLLEQYIGNQLRLIPEADVEPGFRYDRDNKETVDFIVTLPELVVLVEVKSVRPTAAVRAGAPDAESELQRMLGKGVRQIERADNLINNAHPAFAHIPTDRPRAGLLVTMEDFHILNSGFHSPIFHRTSQLPISICSAGELEHWVTVTDKTSGRVVLDAIKNQDISSGPAFSLKQELNGRSHRRNALIDAAWRLGPWQRLREVSRKP